MRILITGGGGLIGQAIAKLHLTHGDSVFLYDDQSNRYNDYEQLYGVNLAKPGSDSPSIFDVIQNNPAFDIISHQAARVGVGESQYEISKYVDANLGFTGELLDSLVKTRKFPSSLLLASSMGPYGEGHYCCTKTRISFPADPRSTMFIKCPFCSPSSNSCQPVPLLIQETDRRNPASIYAVTKLAQEEMFRVFSETHRITTTALRYFSVYGTTCNPNNPYTGVLSVIAGMILNAPVVELFEDGEQTRDLIHCADVASANYLASKIYDGNFRALNICTGKRTSLRSVAEYMMAKLSVGLSKKEIVYTNKFRKGDIRHSCGMNDKAVELLKWKHAYSIRRGMDEYCAFILENKDKFLLGKDTSSQEKERLIERNLIV